MIEVEYFLTAGKRYLEQVAEQLSKGCGETVTVQNNELILPPALGCGSLVQYIINVDLCIVLSDFTLSEEIRFIRPATPVNHFHCLTFNFSTLSYLIEIQGADDTRVRDSWENKIFYSTAEKGLVWTIPEGGRVKSLQLIFTRAWLQKEYQVDRLPAGVPHAEDWANDRAFQFTQDLDIETLLLAQNLFNTSPPEYMADLYYEGAAKRLMAMVANRLIEGPATEHKLNYEEVLQLLSIEQELEKKLNQPLPSLDELAFECSMSKSKFEKLFKAIFGKSLTDFFYHLRMQKATELLRLGYKASKAGQMVGYPNADNFTKMFKSYYKTTPKIYQEKINEQPKDQEG